MQFQLFSLFVFCTFKVIRRRYCRIRYSQKPFLHCEKCDVFTLCPPLVRHTFLRWSYLTGIFHSESWVNLSVYVFGNFVVVCHFSNVFCSDVVKAHGQNFQGQGPRTLVERRKSVDFDLADICHAQTHLISGDRDVIRILCINAQNLCVAQVDIT